MSNEYLDRQHKLASLLLRIGLAFVFLYAAIASFLAPDSWIGYFPLFLRNVIPAQTLLNSFGIYETLLGLWLLWGRHGFYAAALAGLTLLGIIIPNLGALDIIFRDVGILFAALGLVVLNYKEIRE